MEELIINTKMTTNIVYYLLLYILVIIMRFFKLKNQYKTEFNNHWKETFDCAIEIVYTSSGFIIALLLNTAQLIPVIIVGYVIIIITASYLERAGREEFKTNTKFALNVVIILIIVSGTIWLMPPDTDINGHKTENTLSNDSLSVTPDSTSFLVILPYTDESLTKHVGTARFGERKLYEEYVLKEKNESSAILKAIKYFNDSLKPEPMFVKSDKNYQVKLMTDQVMCYKVIIENE